MKIKKLNIFQKISLLNKIAKAWKENQFLIYVSENMNFLKSKLKYFQDGKLKVLKSEGKHLNELV